MEIREFSNLINVEPLKNNSTLILGNFDGVHIGHIELINYAKTLSKNVGILTFEESFKEGKNSLMSLDDKIEFFRKIGLSFVLVLKNNDVIKKTPYYDFINNFLVRLNPKFIVCGEDFKFGYLAQGNIDHLKLFFRNLITVNFVKDSNDNKISSREIKEYIEEGDFSFANYLLGREYKIKGKVVKGRGQGRNLGFPTANIQLNFPYTLPKNGVYLTKIEIDSNLYNSITNIGYSPTLTKGDKKTIETFIIDFDDDIYGKEVSLHFYKFIRNEYKFQTSNQLIEQISNDLTEASDFFSE